MLDEVAAVLDCLGLAVFAVTGALVASRKQMDFVGFAVVGTVTGIGGGTLRDLLLDVPVFWTRQPAYLLTCVAVSGAVFFAAPALQSRYRYILWLDAIGLALFTVTGAEKALSTDAGRRGDHDGGDHRDVRRRDPRLAGRREPGDPEPGDLCYGCVPSYGQGHRAARPDVHRRARRWVRKKPTF